MGINQYDASFLISIIGISNMIGKIVLGWVSDRHWIDRLHLYSIIIGLSGLSKWLGQKKLSVILETFSS